MMAARMDTAGGTGSDGALAARGLVHAYAGRRVLGPIDLDLAPGEIVAVLGPNGAGKSTLLHALAGLLTPESGTVRLGGVDATRLPLHRRGEAGLGYLPQDSASFDELTVADNLRAVAECHGWSRPERQSRVGEALARCGLAELADRRYGTLSGGERRRVEIAKAVLRRPRWLLLDEPYAALDPLAIAATNRVLRQLAAEGTATLVADHRFEVALALADRALVLQDGVVVAAGLPAAVRADARARQAYFGEDAS